MNNAIQDALDDLSSFRSSTSRQGRALDALERLLADTCVSESNSSLRSFNALQDTFQANIPSRLLTWISDRSSYLDSLSQKGTVSQERAPEVTTLSSQLIQSLSIIQGVVLIHAASKQFLGRRFALEIFVDLFLVARHVPQTPSTTTTSNAESSSSSSSKTKSTAPPSLAIAVLDTLLCIMVDAPAALRAFEEANGVRAVVRILKRAGTPRETRMKCLEFLYFYLLDENTPSSNTQSHDIYEIPTVPNSPTNFSHTRAALSLSQISDCSSSSEYSSSGSNVSVSTTATSVLSSSPGSPTTKDVSPLDPSPSIRPGPRKAPSREPSSSRPRSQLLLRKDVEFTSQTPVSVRSTVTATPRAAPRLTQQHSDSVVPLGDYKTPRKLPPRMQATSFGDIDPNTPASAMRARGHRRAHTIDTQADAKVLAQPVMSPPMSPVDRRDSTMGSFMGATSPTRLQVITRTMEEKKAILGGMMGNVDALVEGVKKAGIWGLG